MDSPVVIATNLPVKWHQIIASDPTATDLILYECSPHPARLEPSQHPHTGPHHQGAQQAVNWSEGQLEVNEVNEEKR